MRVLLRLGLASFLISLAKSDNRRCYTCQSSYDHNGDPVGFINPGCFEQSTLVQDYERDCENEDDVCVLDIEVDWMPTGQHVVHTKRGCGKVEDVSLECSGNYNIIPTPMMLYKDCNEFCDRDLCNGGLLFDEVLQKHDSGNSDLTCHSCSFIDLNGNVNGDTKCAEGSSLIGTRPCPAYANAGCFTAASWSDEIQVDMEMIYEEDHRGCSAFTFAAFEDCHTGTSSGNGVSGHWAECKSTCETSNCNTNKLQKRKTCVSCQATRNSDNSTAGLGDDNCWELIGGINTIECDNEDDVCATDLLIDWLPRGGQQATIRRGCKPKSEAEVEDPCIYQDIRDVFEYKDCFVTCADSLCNVGLEDVSQLFSSPNAQESCHVCRYHETNDGQVEGKPDCKDEPKTTEFCPMYANHGCFVGSNIHFVENNAREDVYRGCSSFEREEPLWCGTAVLPDSDGVITSFGVCKEFCKGQRNCNSLEHEKPELPLDGVWSACQTCSVTVDQMNQTLGIGDAKCLEGHDSLIEICPNSEDLCMVDMTVDWYPKGYHSYAIRRGCTSSPAFDECLTGSTALIEYKDCRIDCDPHIQASGCNSGLEAISDKFHDPNGVTSCYVCNYTEHIDGSVEGQKTCGDVVQPGGLIKSQECPRYATTSCYHAASFHKDYINNDAEFTDDFRGCSPFDLDDRYEFCQMMSVQGLDHLNCRDTCTTDNCNTEKIQKKLQCYSCSASRDSTGAAVGVGNDNCFDNLKYDMLVDCDFDQAYCVDELLVDWFYRGEQVAVIRRGCSKINAAQNCQSFEDDMSLRAKDCQISCASSACNNDLTVGDKFIGSYRETECWSCKYSEHDDGTVEGNKFCGDAPIAEFRKECPNYASAACYTGAAIHEFEGEQLHDIYKGCSAFEIQGGLEAMNITLSEGSLDFYLTKTTCRGAACNELHVPPLVEENPEPIVGQKCQVCSVVVDQFNKTVGVGQSGCWEGSEQYLTECDYAESLCTTELEIDWYPRGHFNYRMIRSCSSTPAETECYVGSSTMIQYKDCLVSCDPEVDGAGCNTGLEPVAKKFSTGKVGNCWQCEYVQDFDGTVSGLTECGAEIAGNNLNNIPQQMCPIYADSACFWAASFHKDFGSSGEEMEDDHRGCSPFALERHNQCETMTLSDVEHLNCKDTCEEDFCNVERVTKHLQCHSCQASRDSEGNVVGIGDLYCFDSAESTPLVDCNYDTEFCSTELLVDWYSRGQQVATIRRSCSKVAHQEECSGASSDRIMYKDCFEDCTENGCNIGMEVGDKFYEIYNQGSCYACHYTEEDDGSITGNLNCPDNPTDTMIVECPNYASQGCYTGSAVHNMNGNDLDGRREEVYKGCSTFYIGEQTDYHNETLENGVEYALTKQTCRSDNCNVQHVAPDEPPLLCFQCTIQKDHLGNTIGQAEESCWNSPSPFLQTPCDDVCITEMMVDWFPKGEQIFTLSRKCGKRPITPGGSSCVEENYNTFMWKDCLHYCEEDGCNNNLEEVENLFDQGNEIECYSCKYARGNDGSILDGSNDQCSLPDVSSQIKPVQCGKLQNAACYTAATWHSATDDNIKEDYKGCSAFKLPETDQYCESFQIQGEALSSCKQTCDGAKCNKISPKKSLACYVCDETIDSNNATVGMGNPTCFSNIPDPSYVQECGPGAEYCTVDIETDWFLSGRQTSRIRRGCSSQQAPEECQSSLASNNMFMLKDCSTSCDSSGCNSELLPTAQKFSADNPQEECFSCTYVQKDNGDVTGNKYCAEEPDKLEFSTVKCPLWANVACYTGTNAHYNEKGVVMEEVYKGCSTFSAEPFLPPEGDHIICDVVYNTTINDEEDVEYGVCKQTCSGSTCNKNHIRPCVPHAGDDCSDSVPTPPPPPSGATRPLLSLFAVLVFYLTI